MATAADTSVSFAGIVEFPAKLVKATGSGKLNLETRCDVCHGKPEQSIACGCGRTERSWFAFKEKVHPDTGITFSPDELKNAKETAPPRDNMNVDKTVDLAPFLAMHGIGEPHYVLPPQDATETTLRMYRLFLDSLSDTRRGALTKLTQRKSTRRWILLADAVRGLLMAYEVSDLREPPWDVQKVTVDEKQRKKVQFLLDETFSADPAYPADEDPLVRLLETKLAAAQPPAIAASPPMPQTPPAE